MHVGAGCATLFALPFLLGGLAMLVAAARGGAAPGGPDDAPPWVLAPMGLLFLVVGAGVPIGAWYGISRLRESQRLREANPDRPWLWRADWASGRIRCQSSVEAILLWFFAILWNSISWSVLGAAWEDLSEQGPIGYVLLVFPLVGVGLLAWAIVSTLRRRKYGASELTLASLPGVVGGRLAGRLETTFKEPPAKGARLRLDCSQTTGSGKSSTTRTIWTSEQTVPASRMSVGWQGVSIPVEFGIPSHCPATSDWEIGGPNALRISWKLYVSADTPGLDYQAHFEVPVFRTEESRDDIGEVEARALQRDSATALAFDAALASFVERTGPRGEPELHFPANKRRKEAAALFAFSLLWLGVAAAIFHFDGPLWFAIPWTAIGLLMLYGVLQLAFGWATIRLRDGNLEVESRTLGIGRTRSAPAREIAAIKPAAPGVNQGSAGQPPSVWREVHAERADGSRALRLGRPTSSLAEAEAIAAWARRVCGIR